MNESQTKKTIWRNATLARATALVRMEGAADVEGYEAARAAYYAALKAESKAVLSYIDCEHRKISEGK